MRGTWGVITAIALGGALLAVIVASETALVRRGQLANGLIPLERALERTERDTYLLSAESRALLIAAPAADLREQAETSRSRLARDIAELEALGPSSTYAAEVTEVGTLARAYQRVASESLRLAAAGDFDGARRVVTAEGTPTLEEFAAAAGALDTQLILEQERLAADVAGIELVQRVALALSGALALITIAVMAMVARHASQLAEALRAESARAEAIIDGVPGVVWEARGPANASEQQFSFVSDYAETLLGYKPEIWLATPHFGATIIHPDDRARVASEATAIIASGRPGATEFRWVASDGRALWVRAVLTAIRDASGRLAGTRGVTVDITEQHEAEEALMAERARFATMVGTLPYGVCQLDSRGLIDYLNATGQRLLGCTAAQALGRPFHELVHVVPLPGTETALDHPEAECIGARVLEQAAAIEVRDTLARRNGTTFLADVVAAPIRSMGRVSGAVLTFQDATERQRREQLKDDYLAFAAHELRSPLTAVSAMAQYLERRAAARSEAFDDDSREAIDTLARDTERVVRMTEVFLDLARIESDRLVIESERVDLAAVAHEEAEAARREAPHMQLEVTTDAPLAVWTDDLRVRQIVRNLLGNAARHAGPTPQVALRLTADDEWARIEVSDDGPGIRPEEREHIFERLYRGEGRREPGGLGAGLFITREIVERLGGTIRVKSVPNLGATFTVQLPLTSESM